MVHQPHLTTKNLIQREVDKGKKQKEIASLLGVSTAYVNGILKGRKQANSRLFEFAEKLGIDVLDVPDRHYQRPIPVISWIHAGAFAEPADQWPPGVSGEEEPVFSYKNVCPHAFGLRVEGDSMAPRFLPGDIIIVDPEIRCDNGAACVVWINGEVSLKLFFEDEREIRLVPLNEKHDIRVIPKDRKVDFKVIGKVVDLVAKL